MNASAADGGPVWPRRFSSAAHLQEDPRGWQENSAAPNLPQAIYSEAGEVKS